MKRTGFLIALGFALGTFLLPGCGEEKLRTAGEGGKPPPFQDKINEGLAKRNAGQQSDRPSSGGATKLPN